MRLPASFTFLLPRLRGYRLSSGWTCGLLLAIPLCAGGLSVYGVNEIQSQLLRKEFRLKAAQTVTVLQQRLERIEQAAQSAAYFIGSDEKIKQPAKLSVLSAYLSALKFDTAMPSLQAIDFAPADVVAPRPPAISDTAAPIMKAALRHVYDAGSRRLESDIFIHDGRASNPTSGFVLMLPVFDRTEFPGIEPISGQIHNALRGHVVAAIDSKAFFADGLQRPVQISQVHIGSKQSPMQRLVYQNDLQDASADPLRESATLTAAGYTWTVNLDAAPEFIGMAAPTPAYIGVTVELSVCLLVFWLMRQLARPPDAAPTVDVAPVSFPSPAPDNLDRAEEAIGFGLYEIDLDLCSGRQSACWSRGLYRILERDVDSAPLDNDAFIERHVHESDRQRIRMAIAEILQDGGTATYEYRIASQGGRTIYLRDSIEVRTLSPTIRKLCGIRRDISDKRQAENERFASSMRFQALVEQLPGVPYLASLKSNRGTMYVSPKVESLIGYRPDEWADGRALRISRVHPQDRKNLMRRIAVAKKNRMPFKMEYRIYHRNGDLLWIHDEARIIANDAGEALFLQGVVLDITERKKAQNELHQSHQRLQQMIAALDTLRDDEHKRLAREMHDDFGQLLIAMKMDLLALSHQVRGHDRQLQRQVAGVQRLADTMITSVRRIIADLPPKALDGNDLFKALELLVRGFEKRHRIACNLVLPQAQPTLADGLAMPIYRVIQEALTNIAKHARASQADIQLACNEACLTLRIRDNGKGLSTDEMQKTGSFGLIGMRERIAALEGELEIDSAPGAGTMLHVTIPLAPVLGDAGVDAGNDALCLYVDRTVSDHQQLLS